MFTDMTGSKPDPTNLKKRYGVLEFSKKSYLASLVRATCFDDETLENSLSKRAGVEGCISGLKRWSRII